jgi:hypothetical protein
MRKLRLTLKANVEAWSFTLFDSPEAVYYLGTSTPEPEDEFCCNVSLSPGDFLEVEWMGAEYLHDDAIGSDAFSSARDSDRYDKIRLAKMYDIARGTILLGSGFVESYSGWVPSGTIPWNSKTHRHLKITKINSRNKPKLNLSELFEDVAEEPSTKKAAKSLN